MNHQHSSKFSTARHTHILERNFQKLGRAKRRRKKAAATLDAIRRAAAAAAQKKSQKSKERVLKKTVLRDEAPLEK